MRVGEVTGLQWDDLDFDNGLISVNRTLINYSKGKGLNNRYAINTPKTESGKWSIPMVQKVKDAFLMERELQKTFGKDTIWSRTGRKS